MSASEPNVDSTAAAIVGSALTVQERACLQLVAQRLSSKEIAARLGIAKTSVDTYCDRARRKLGVSDRYTAARLVTMPETTSAASSVATAAPQTSRALVAWVAFGVVSAALGVGALLAGMSALEALKPPDWDKRVSAAAAKAAQTQ